MRRIKMVLVTTCVLAWSGYAQDKAGDALTLDASFPIQSQSVEVQFYHRGPVGTPQAGQPPEYIRGIRVTESSPNFKVLDSWEGQPTTIVAFDRKLNKIWTAGRTPIITAITLYGGRVAKLTALLWTGGKLKQVNEWDGAGFSIIAMGSPPEPVIAVNSSDYSRVPELYAWNGNEFQPASDRFPAYFASLAAKYAAPIYDYSSSKVAAALEQSCRLSLEAYKLAHDPEAGRKVCIEARDRISNRRAIAPALKPEDSEREKSTAISHIDSLTK
jgi:hypothetical protein